MARGATGNEILSYKGESAAALAGDEGRVAGLTDTSLITQTARDLAIQSAAVNLNIWKQKLTERDQVYKMIDDDQLILDNIPEEHRQRLEEEKKKIQDIFYKYNGDIMSDPKRFREFQTQIAKAKGDINQSHKWYTWLTNELENRTKNTNPVDQQKIDRHIAQQWDKNKQDFYSLPDPYAPLTHFDLTVVAAKPVMTSPAVEHKGDYDITTTKVDPGKTFDYYQRNWAKPESNHMFSNYIFGDKDGTYGGFLAGPNNEKDIKRVNDALLTVNAQLGLAPGQPGYITPLGVEKDPLDNTKWRASTDRPDQIAAKIALADNPALVTTSEFAQHRVSAGIQRGQLKEETRHNKATEGLEGTRLANEKEKWQAATKGTETSKNSAWEYAAQTVARMESMGQQGFSGGQPSGNIVIGPDQLRNLTAEDLRGLGIEKYDERTGKSGLVPLAITKETNNIAIQIEPDPAGGANKIIRVLTEAKFDPATGKWNGKVDPTKSTTLRNIAINRLNDENEKSGTKERNAYEPVDTGAGGTSISTSGGGTNASGGSSKMLRFSDNSTVPLNLLSPEQIKAAKAAGAVEQ